MDGSNLAYVVMPETFADFVDLVVPELQRGGVTNWITRLAHCRRSSTAQVARGSARIIQR